MFDALLLKRAIAQFKKAEQSIEIIKSSEMYPKLISINGIRINFGNLRSYKKTITFKHNLNVKIDWIVNFSDKPVDDSNIILNLSTNDFRLRHKENHNFLYVREFNLRFKLNDDYTIDFEDFPKNIYEWDEEHFLYYSLRIQ